MSSFVGAPLDDEGAIGPGAAYVFHFDGKSWVEVQRLTPSDAEHVLFGQTLAVEGERLLVGAPGSEGAAYYFRYDETRWTEDTESTSNIVTNCDRLGGTHSHDCYEAA